MDSHFRELLRGSAGGLFARALSAFGVFAFGVMLAKLLGAADSGLFYLALAPVSMAASLSRVGLGGTVVRFVATHLAHDETRAAGIVYARVVLVVLVLAILASLVLYAGAEQLAVTTFDKPQMASALRGMVFVLVPLALYMLYGQFLLAEKRVGAAVLVQTGLLPLLMTLVLVVAPTAWHLAEVIWAYVGAAFVTLIVAMFWQHRGSAYKPVFVSSYDFSSLIQSARSLAVSDLVNKGIQPWAPIIFLGVWSSATSIGLLAAANRLAALVVFASIPVNRMLAPKMAALWAQDDRASFYRLSRQAALLMFAASMPVALVLFIAPGKLLALFGSEFTSAGLLVWVLVAGQLLNALTGPVRSMLIMTGNEKDHRSASVIGGVVLVLLCVALIPEQQAVGAAIATASGMAATNIAAAAFVWRRLGVVPLLGGGRT